ncbi:MAG: 50S ribosomal protein L23 [Clostridia bacterium]|nr:50S ribosomal protein L23 [Clostridia bacterium]
MNAYDIIIKPVLTEKSFDGIPDRCYTFIVAKKATKTQVKEAVEQIFGVDVAKVNIVNTLGKIKRMGAHQGRRPSLKKAYVTLKEDSKGIEFFDSMGQ